MSSRNQRKRRNPSTSSSTRRVCKHDRTGTMPVEPALPATETIDVVETVATSEEVVDLTCEGSEAAPVVDLTANDSVVVVDEGPRGRRGGTDSESYVLSSDEEDTNTTRTAAALLSLQANSRARATPGIVSCPVCMDAYAEIVESGRLVVSTKCGHLFCSQCLRDSLNRSHTCPTCRKKLTHRQYHPIYV